MSEKTQTDPFITNPPKINGITLRRMSMGAYQILHDKGNRYVTPKKEGAPTPTHPELLRQAAELVYACSAPVEEVREKSDDPDEWDKAVAAVQDSIPLSAQKELFSAIQRVMDEVNAANGYETNGESDPNS